MKVRIEADRERCVGAGMCVLSAPDVFDQDVQDGRVRIHIDTVTPDVMEAVRKAVELCPSGALTIHEIPTRAE